MEEQQQLVQQHSDTHGITLLKVLVELIIPNMVYLHIHLLVITYSLDHLFLVGLFLLQKANSLGLSTMFQLQLHHQFRLLPQL